MVRVVKKSKKESAFTGPAVVGSSLQPDVDSVIVLVDERLQWIHLLTQATASSDAIAIKYPTSQHTKSGLWQVNSNFYEPPKLYQQHRNRTAGPRAFQPEHYAAELWKQSEHGELTQDDVVDGKARSEMVKARKVGSSSPDFLETRSSENASKRAKVQQFEDTTSKTVQSYGNLPTDVSYRHLPATSASDNSGHFSCVTNHASNVIHSPVSSALQKVSHAQILTPNDMAEALGLYKAGEIQSTRRYLFAGQPREHVYISPLEQNKSLSSWRKKLLKKQLAFEHLPIEDIARRLIETYSIFTRHEISEGEFVQDVSSHANQANSTVDECRATCTTFSPQPHGKLSNQTLAKPVTSLGLSKVTTTSTDMCITDKSSNEDHTHSLPTISVTPRGEPETIQPPNSTQGPNNGNALQTDPYMLNHLHSSTTSRNNAVASPDRKSSCSLTDKPRDHTVLSDVGDGKIFQLSVESTADQSPISNDIPNDSDISNELHSILGLRVHAGNQSVADDSSLSETAKVDELTYSGLGCKISADARSASCNLLSQTSKKKEMDKSEIVQGKDSQSDQATRTIDVCRATLQTRRLDKAKKNSISHSRVTGDQMRKPHLVSSLEHSLSSYLYSISDSSNVVDTSPDQRTLSSSADKPRNHTVLSDVGRNKSSKFSAGDTAIGNETPNHSDIDGELLSTLGLRMLADKQSIANNSPFPMVAKVDEMMSSVLGSKISADVQPVSCKSLSKANKMEETGSPEISRNAIDLLSKGSADGENVSDWVRKLSTTLGSVENVRCRKQTGPTSEINSGDVVTRGCDLHNNRPRLKNAGGCDKVNGKVKEVDLEGNPSRNVENNSNIHELEDRICQIDLPVAPSTQKRPIHSVLGPKSKSMDETSRCAGVKADVTNASLSVDASTNRKMSSERFGHPSSHSKHIGSCPFHENGQHCRINQPVTKLQRLEDTFLRQSYSDGMPSKEHATRVAKKQTPSITHLPVLRPRLHGSKADVAHGPSDVDSVMNVSERAATSVSGASKHSTSRKRSSTSKVVGDPISNCLEVLKTLLPSSVPISESASLEYLSAYGFKHEIMVDVSPKAERFSLNDRDVTPAAEGFSKLTPTSTAIPFDTNAALNLESNSSELANKNRVKHQASPHNTSEASELISHSTCEVRQRDKLSKASLHSGSMHGFSNNLLISQDTPTTINLISRKMCLPADTSIGRSTHEPKSSLAHVETFGSPSNAVSSNSQVSAPGSLEGLNMAHVAPKSSASVTQVNTSDVPQQNMSASFQIPSSLCTRPDSIPQSFEYSPWKTPQHSCNELSHQSLLSSSNSKLSKIMLCTSSKTPQRSAGNGTQSSANKLLCSSPKTVKDQSSTTMLQSSMTTRQNLPLTPRHGLSMIPQYTSPKSPTQCSPTTTMHRPIQPRQNIQTVTAGQQSSAQSPLTTAIVTNHAEFKSANDKKNAVTIPSSTSSSLASWESVCDNQKTPIAVSVHFPHSNHLVSSNNVVTTKSYPSSNTRTSLGRYRFSPVLTSASKSGNGCSTGFKRDCGVNKKFQSPSVSTSKGFSPCSTPQLPNCSNDIPEPLFSDAPLCSSLNGTPTSTKRSNDSSDVINYCLSTSASTKATLRSTRSASTIQVKPAKNRRSSSKVDITSESSRKNRLKQHKTKVSMAATLSASQNQVTPAKADVTCPKKPVISKSSRKCRPKQLETNISMSTVLSSSNNQVKPAQASNSSQTNRSKQHKTRGSLNTTLSALEKRVKLTRADVSHSKNPVTSKSSRKRRPKQLEKKKSTSTVLSASDDQVNPAQVSKSSQMSRSKQHKTKVSVDTATSTMNTKKSTESHFNKTPEPLEHLSTPPKFDSVDQKSLSKSAKGKPEHAMKNSSSKSNSSKIQSEPANHGSPRKFEMTDKSAKDLIPVLQSQNEPKYTPSPSRNRHRRKYRPGNLLPSAKISGSERSQYFMLMAERDGQTVEVLSSDGQIDFQEIDTNANQAVPVLSLEGL